MKFKNLLERCLIVENTNNVYYQLGLDSLFRQGDQSELEILNSKLVLKSHMHMKDDINPETLETDNNYDYIKVTNHKIERPNIVNVRINVDEIDKKIVPLRQGIAPILHDLQDSNISVYETNGTPIKGPRKNQLILGLLKELSSEKSELGRSVKYLKGASRHEHSSESLSIPYELVKKGGSIRSIYSLITNFGLKENVKFFQGEGLTFGEEGKVEVSNDFRNLLMKLLDASRRFAHLNMTKDPEEKAIITKFLELTPGKTTIILSTQNIETIKKQIEKTELKKKDYILKRLLKIDNVVDIEVDGYDSLKDFVDSIEIKYTV